MIDNHPVKIGDKVYVLGIGNGSVVSVNADGGFSVKTGSGEAYYRDGGFIGNQRRVYWSDPIIINPPRNRRLWQSYCKIAVQLFKELETVMSFFSGGSNEDNL